jgi:hypothetical protein
VNETINTIYKLESYPESIDIDIDELLKIYKQVYPDRPLWKMIEDIERQAMLYTNIIELLKSGKPASTIRKNFEALDLMPPNILPNPNVPALLTKAFNKVSQYRKALVEIIKRYGGELLNELSFEVGLTVSVGVDVGFPPSITIAVEHTATIQEIRKF